jgi:hypothetical protein
MRALQHANRVGPLAEHADKYPELVLLPLSVSMVPRPCPAHVLCTCTNQARLLTPGSHRASDAAAPEQNDCRDVDGALHTCPTDTSTPLEVAGFGEEVVVCTPLPEPSAKSTGTSRF